MKSCWYYGALVTRLPHQGGGATGMLVVGSVEEGDMGTSSSCVVGMLGV